MRQVIFVYERHVHFLQTSHAPTLSSPPAAPAVESRFLITAADVMPLFEVRDLVRLLSSQSPLSLQQRVSHLGAKHQVLSNASWNELKLFGAIKVLVEVVTTDEWDILSPTEQVRLAWWRFHRNSQRNNHLSFISAN